jgi:hypothetical protein
MSSKSQIKSFYQDPDGRWYIDLPEYIESGLGTKGNLEMVSGADTMLSNLANGEKRITLQFSPDPFHEYDLELGRVKKPKDGQWWYNTATTAIADTLGLNDYMGAWYKVKENDHELWLCPVTMYVFGGKYPKNIYVKKMN